MKETPTVTKKPCSCSMRKAQRGNHDLTGLFVNDQDTIDILSQVPEIEIGYVAQQVWGEQFRENHPLNDENVQGAYVIDLPHARHIVTSEGVTEFPNYVAADEPSRMAQILRNHVPEDTKQVFVITQEPNGGKCLYNKKHAIAEPLEAMTKTYQ